MCTKAGDLILPLVHADVNQELINENVAGETWTDVHEETPTPTAPAGLRLLQLWDRAHCMLVYTGDPVPQKEKQGLLELYIRVVNGGSSTQNRR